MNKAIEEWSQKPQKPEKPEKPQKRKKPQKPRWIEWVTKTHPDISRTWLTRNIDKIAVPSESLFKQ